MVEAILGGALGILGDALIIWFIVFYPERWRRGR